MIKDMSNRHRTGVLLIFLTAAIFLMPWTIYLSRDLPSFYIAKNWDVTWVGIDSLMILSFLLSAIFGYIRSRWLLVSLSSSITLLLLDGWLDLTTSWHTRNFNQSVVLAIFFEIPAILFIFLYIQYLLHKHLR